LDVSTLATLITTIIFTIHCRKTAARQLTKERERADERLVEERAATGRRAAEQRVHAEQLRRRERQQDSTARLLAQIASITPYMTWVPDVDALANQMRNDQTVVTTFAAVRSLEFGATADVAGLGDPQAARQYRSLVHLVLTAAGLPDEVPRCRVGGDLRRYALFVQVSLENLVEHEASLDAGTAEPMLTRDAHDHSLWAPSITPQAWQDAIAREPTDPQYRPAR
jgi:hypothetical protein